MSEKNSFFKKEQTTCPVCDSGFFVERVFSGRGRLNSATLLPDLRRTYRPSKKFGTVYPLIYNMLVCPDCWYAALPEDFLIMNAYDFKALRKSSEERRRYGDELLPEVSFSGPRTLKSGTLSFFLGLFSYTYFLDKNLTWMKKALMAIRAAWCLEDLASTTNHASYAEMAQLMRYFALKCYSIYFDKFNNELRDTTLPTYFGPDLDHDYGTGGFLYLTAYLFEYFKALFPAQEQIARFKVYRRMIGKVFGVGKSSPRNPSPLLVHIRSLYEQLSLSLKGLENTAGVP